MDSRVGNLDPMTMWQNLDMHRKDAKATHGRVYKACGGKWHQELELREEPKRKAGRMRERLEEAERKAERKIQMTRQVLLSLRGYTV